MAIAFLDDFLQHNQRLRPSKEKLASKRAAALFGSPNDVAFMNSLRMACFKDMSGYALLLTLHFTIATVRYDEPRGLRDRSAGQNGQDRRVL